LAARRVVPPDLIAFAARSPIFKNDGGIMDLWMREARLFKYGSGTGSNFSNPFSWARLDSFQRLTEHS